MDTGILRYHSPMAAKKRKSEFEISREKEKAAKAKVWAALWDDPKYLRIVARKEIAARLWNQLDSERGMRMFDAAKTAKADATLKRWLRAMYMYEERALAAAGLRG